MSLIECIARLSPPAPVSIQLVRPSFSRNAHSGLRYARRCCFEFHIPNPSHAEADYFRLPANQHGSFIALNCTGCHGEEGVSQPTFIPILAGMDPAAIFKQLDDYRSGKRLWGVMGAIAKALSTQDSADVVAYFAARPKGLAAMAHEGRESGSKESDSARRLAFIGDEQRGIPPCTACHGPHGYKIGAPPLAGQHAAYIERQLAAFAQGLRQNDINEQMRAIAKQLTPSEMHALAAFYGAPESARVANK
jgi:cytochrome c553